MSPAFEARRHLALVRMEKSSTDLGALELDPPNIVRGSE